METIFAQSSAPGKSAIAVFRLSGKGSLAILQKLLDAKEDKNLTARKLYYRKIFHPLNKELIDYAMVTYFKAPFSFTGEDTVEIYTHGSLAISTLMIDAFGSFENARMAEPGEFAKRAFYNNKMDLTSAEGLADLINAQTIMQHKQAIRQAGGELENFYNELRRKLLKISAMLEAYIDFPDEEIPESALERARQDIEIVRKKITDHLNDNNRAERLRNGLYLAIIGPPNSGKSSLINYLLKREVAIVSPIAGTTRDVVEAHIDIGGYPLIIQDTAGIRENSDDIIEKEGIKKSLSSASKADILIFMNAVNDLTQIVEQDEVLGSQMSSLVKDKENNNEVISLINKIDILPLEKKEKLTLENSDKIYISIKNNIGLDLVIKEIEKKAKQKAGISEAPSITRERHRQQLKKALHALNEININQDLVLAAEDIRITINSLSNLTGQIKVDEILGEIFSNFCIGK